MNTGGGAFRGKDKLWTTDPWVISHHHHLSFLLPAGWKGSTTNKALCPTGPCVILGSGGCQKLLTSGGRSGCLCPLSPGSWLITEDHGSQGHTLTYFFSPVGFSLLSISTIANQSFSGSEGFPQHDCGSKYQHFMEGVLVWLANYMGIILAGPLTMAVNDSLSNSLSS